MSRLHQYLMLMIFSIFMGSVFANTNNTKPTNSSEIQLKYYNIAAYMGTRVDLLPKELAAQLPEDVLVGQGIMVTGFTENSPAKRDGLKVYDILLTYDRHALMHPKEFIDLIRKDKPGRKVKLKLVRKGKIISVEVTLASQRYELDEDQLDYQYNLMVLGYDGMRINQLGKDNFKAVIRYLSTIDGVVKRYTFSGSYKKILYDIYAAKDLSNIAKHDLKKAITKRKTDEEGWFGKWIPFGDGNFSPDNMKRFGLPK